MRMRGKRGFLLATCVVAALAAQLPAYAKAPTKAGGIRFSLRLSTHRLSHRSSVRLFIRMQTGAHGQTAGVAVFSSDWGEPNVWGSVASFSAQRITGAGKITGGFATSGGGYGGGAPLCVRGPLQTGSGGPQVSLPPHSVTVLSYRVRLAAPPWPGLRPRVGAWAYVPAQGRHARSYQLGSLDLRLVGRTGVRILLSAEHKTTKGTRVLITGRTDPAIAGGHMTLAAERYTNNQGGQVTQVAIGSTLTSSDGKFHIWWRPERSGSYLIVAHLHHPGGRYLPDRGCDLSIGVR